MGVEIFHAGTRRRAIEIVADGGRVLVMTGVASDLSGARDNAYAAVEGDRMGERLLSQRHRRAGAGQARLRARAKNVADPDDAGAHELRRRTRHCGQRAAPAARGSLPRRRRQSCARRGFRRPALDLRPSSARKILSRSAAPQASSSAVAPGNGDKPWMWPLNARCRSVPIDRRFGLVDLAGVFDADRALRRERKLSPGSARPSFRCIVSAASCASRAINSSLFSSGAMGVRNLAGDGARVEPRLHPHD